MAKLKLEVIKKRRLKLKISLQEMADSFGFKNASTYMKYEKGDYSFKADHVPILAEKLECTIQELFFDNEFADLANKVSTA